MYNHLSKDQLERIDKMLSETGAEFPVTVAFVSGTLSVMVDAEASEVLISYPHLSMGRALEIAAAIIRAGYLDEMVDFQTMIVDWGWDDIFYDIETTIPTITAVLIDLTKTRTLADDFNLFVTHGLEGVVNYLDAYGSLQKRTGLLLD